MRGPSTVLFRPKQNLVLEHFPTQSGPVRIVYISRWLERAEGVTVPGHLWIEIRGIAPDIERAIRNLRQRWTGCAFDACYERQRSGRGPGGGATSLSRGASPGSA